MVDYSQCGEQQAILNALSGYEEHLRGGARRILQFLDIGAWHPKTFSNTRALYEQGWSGVMVEPSPLPMESLLREYGNDDRITLVSAAVGVENGMARLAVTADAVSTTDTGEAEKWKDAGGYYGAMLVPVLTIHDIVNRFGSFAFVNIDAEGLSVNIFLDMLVRGIFPKCVCVEHNDRLAEIMGPAGKDHYVMSFANGTNAVLVQR